MTKQPKQKPLTGDEIDEIVIAQVDDDNAWEEEISVTPVSRPHVTGVDSSADRQGQRHPR
jgi:hypothetical protein